MSERPNHTAGCECNRCHWADVAESNAIIAQQSRELAEARESNNKLRTELDRLHSLPDDLRTCGEISGDDCNARVVGLRTELADLRKRCEEAEKVIGLAEMMATTRGLAHHQAEAELIFEIRARLAARREQSATAKGE